MSHFPQSSTRRQFLLNAGGGFGAIALSALLSEEGLLRSVQAEETEQQSNSDATDPLAPKDPHFKPRAKRVIYLFMHGGPSHMDLFDPKPDLVKYAGQPLPEIRFALG